MDPQPLGDLAIDRAQEFQELDVAVTGQALSWFASELAIEIAPFFNLILGGFRGPRTRRET